MGRDRKHEIQNPDARNFGLWNRAWSSGEECPTLLAFFMLGAVPHPLPALDPRGRSPVDRSQPPTCLRHYDPAARIQHDLLSRLNLLGCVKTACIKTAPAKGMAAELENGSQAS